MLIHPQNGFHFTGTSASLAQLEDFSIARMGRKIQEVAPNLWQLLGDLLEKFGMYCHNQRRTPRDNKDK